MTGWTSDELSKIEGADELEIASLRRDGQLRHATTIWVVRLGDDLYVRSVNGRASAWFRGTQVRHEGRIRAGGVEKDVTFAHADHDIDDEIDAAYRTKYRRYSARIVDSVGVPQRMNHVERTSCTRSASKIPCTPVHTGLRPSDCSAAQKMGMFVA